MASKRALAPHILKADILQYLSSLGKDELIDAITFQTLRRLPHLAKLKGEKKTAKKKKSEKPEEPEESEEGTFGKRMVGFVVEAVRELRDCKNGSSRAKIKKYIERNRKIELVPTAFRAALAKAVADGHLERRGNSFRLVQQSSDKED